MELIVQETGVEMVMSFGEPRKIGVNYLKAASVVQWVTNVEWLCHLVTTIPIVLVKWSWPCTTVLILYGLRLVTVLINIPNTSHLMCILILGVLQCNS